MRPCLFFLSWNPFIFSSGVECPHSHLSSHFPVLFLPFGVIAPTKHQCFTSKCPHSLLRFLSWQVTGRGPAPCVGESRAQARENSRRRVSEEELLLSGNTSFTFFQSSLLSLAAATETRLRRWDGDLLIILERNILSSGILRAGRLPFLVGCNYFCILSYSGISWSCISTLYYFIES